jgi:UDPglucose 6-dehydrogenase
LKVTVIGTGYVGLVTGACLADNGHEVLCVDIDAAKVERLRNGEIPIFEPGLDQIVKRNVDAQRLFFTTSPEEGAKFGVIQMIAVGTPPDEDGSADLQYVLAAARGIAKYMDEYRVVVDKSTVPVGTGDLVHAALADELALRECKHGFAVVSNPEFLKEGAAVEDFMKPDRIVLGVDDPRAEALLRELYAPFQRNHDRTVVMSRRSAELTKYAANAMLATRISFMNDLANLAERMGCDIEDVRRGIGSDPRIGYSFLYSGTGYGGSCFPKDVKALLQTGKQQGLSLRILDAVELVNDDQKLTMVKKAQARFGDLKGRTFALWGLAFKPNTDDMREAPSRAIVEALWELGAKVRVYDPIAMHEFSRTYGERADLVYCKTPMEAAVGADALMVVTEWKEFRSPDFTKLKGSLKNAIVFDGRNMYDPKQMQNHGYEYYGIGRGATLATGVHA